MWDGRRRILVLDLDERLLIALERALEDSGFSATTTWDVGEARTLMEGGGFDFLVIGNHLPELKTQELITYLREQGLRFGYSVLGSLDQHYPDECGNLIARLRSFPWHTISAGNRQPALNRGVANS